MCPKYATEFEQRNIEASTIWRKILIRCAKMRSNTISRDRWFDLSKISTRSAFFSDLRGFCDIAVRLYIGKANVRSDREAANIAQAKNRWLVELYFCQDEASLLPKYFEQIDNRSF
jgi:hypothetical protein